MPKWIGGSAISKTRYWVKEFLAQGEPALRGYIEGMRVQYTETRNSKDRCSIVELTELAECGKYAAAAYRKAYGKDCPK